MAFLRIKIERVEEVPETKRAWEKVADSGNPRDGGTQYDYATYPGTTYNTDTVLEAKVQDTSVERAKITAVIAHLLDVIDVVPLGK